MKKIIEEYNDNIKIAISYYPREREVKLLIPIEQFIDHERKIDTLALWDMFQAFFESSELKHIVFFGTDISVEEFYDFKKAYIDIKCDWLLEKMPKIEHLFKLDNGQADISEKWIG